LQSSTDSGARLSAGWFKQFDAARFERDAKAGKLDQLAEQAIADHRNGRSPEL
jgi:hypothetical protein